MLQFLNISLTVLNLHVCVNVLAFMREFKIFEFVLCFENPIWFLSTLIIIWNLPCKTNDTGHWEPKRLKKNLESLCNQMLYRVIISTVLSETRKWGSERLSAGPKAARVPGHGGGVSGLSSREPRARRPVSQLPCPWQCPGDAQLSSPGCVERSRPFLPWRFKFKQF